ncbi:MAG: rRNA maturation RNase YbeY [Nitrospirota bacterium]
MSTILIRSNLRKKSPATASIKKFLRKLLKSAGLPDRELSVFFVGDQAMRSLNRRYRGKDRTTDVLSFSYGEGSLPSFNHTPLGDIVISLPTAERQAREQGHTADREFERLLIHGFVHLLGYDHERSDHDAARMARKERQLLKRLR